ncbi:MAG: FAD-dependent oxidoreductase [Gammaproteobacteria bacterium]
MAEDQATPDGPDLTKGIALTELADGQMLTGHVGKDQVLLVRRGAEVFAIGAHCTHYHAPLIDGIVVNDTVRCPWHHACFDLRTGEASRPPAFNPVTSWIVEHRADRIFVQEKRSVTKPAQRIKLSPSAPKRIVIVGGGAAGFAAAERLRREHYQGELVMLSSDDSAPVDRPNLSKDYLAGSAPEDWVPLQPKAFYRDNHIDLRLSANVTGIDVESHQVVLANGNSLPYDRLLLATGAEPARLAIPGADQPHVCTLRSLSDSRAIIGHALKARRAVVLGASFIGLEVAAALRARNIEVHVVDPGKRPMERVFGSGLADFVRSLHEEHGVIFHMGDTASAIDATHVQLTSGARLKADLVVVGIGVRPRLELAAKAGVTIDRGVIVNEYLETSITGIYAAGDIARWPDAISGGKIRVEHWVVAQRQGQTAALNMLGQQQKFAAVPYFWSQHYDVQINYVGHAETWDELVIEGNIAQKDCLVRYMQNGRTGAVASIFRDVDSLQAELAMEKAVP